MLLIHTQRINANNKTAYSVSSGADAITVLLLRFGIAAVVMAAIMLVRKEPFPRGRVLQLSARMLLQPNNTHILAKSANRGRIQFIHEDDLASALVAMIQHDLPGAYNVVGDGFDTQINIAKQAGLQVIEVPDEIFLPQVEQAWQAGLSAAGLEWARGDSNIICSNEKLKATGVWTPRYSTMEAFAATVKALTK